MKRNIPSTPVKLPQYRSRPRPADSDSIQRMIANLPAKRSTRRVIQFADGDMKTRSQATITSVTFGTGYPQHKVRPVSPGVQSANRNRSPRKSSAPAAAGKKATRPSLTLQGSRLTIAGEGKDKASKRATRSAIGVEGQDGPGKKTATRSAVSAEVQEVPGKKVTRSALTAENQDSPSKKSSTRSILNTVTQDSPSKRGTSSVVGLDLAECPSKKLTRSAVSAEFEDSPSKKSTRLSAKMAEDNHTKKLTRSAISIDTADDSSKKCTQLAVGERQENSPTKKINMDTTTEKQDALVKKGVKSLLSTEEDSAHEKVTKWMQENSPKKKVTRSASSLEIAKSLGKTLARSASEIDIPDHQSEKQIQFTHSVSLREVPRRRSKANSLENSSLVSLPVLTPAVLQDEADKEARFCLAGTKLSNSHKKQVLNNEQGNNLDSEMLLLSQSVQSGDSSCKTFVETLVTSENKEQIKINPADVVENLDENDRSGHRQTLVIESQEKRSNISLNDGSPTKSSMPTLSACVSDSELLGLTLEPKEVLAKATSVRKIANSRNRKKTKSTPTVLLEVQASHDLQKLTSSYLASEKIPANKSKRPASGSKQIGSRKKKAVKSAPPTQQEDQLSQELLVSTPVNESQNFPAKKLTRSVPRPRLKNNTGEKVIKATSKMLPSEQMDQEPAVVLNLLNACGKKSSSPTLSHRLKGTPIRKPTRTASTAKVEDQLMQMLPTSNLENTQGKIKKLSKLNPFLRLQHNLGSNTQRSPVVPEDDSHQSQSVQETPLGSRSFVAKKSTRFRSRAKPKNGSGRMSNAAITPGQRNEFLSASDQVLEYGETSAKKSKKLSTSVNPNSTPNRTLLRSLPPSVTNSVENSEPGRIVAANNVGEMVSEDGDNPSNILAAMRLAMLQTGPADIMCKGCALQFDSLSAHDRHSKMCVYLHALSDQHSCHHCGKVFKFPTSLMEHLEDCDVPMPELEKEEPVEKKSDELSDDIPILSPVGEVPDIMLGDAELKSNKDVRIHNAFGTDVADNQMRIDTVHEPVVVSSTLKVPQPRPKSFTTKHRPPRRKDRPKSVKARTNKLEVIQKRKVVNNTIVEDTPASAEPMQKCTELEHDTKKPAAVSFLLKSECDQRTMPDTSNVIGKLSESAQAVVNTALYSKGELTNKKSSVSKQARKMKSLKKSLVAIIHVSDTQDTKTSIEKEIGLQTKNNSGVKITIKKTDGVLKMTSTDNSIPWTKKPSIKKVRRKKSQNPKLTGMSEAACENRFVTSSAGVCDSAALIMKTIEEVVLAAYSDQCHEVQVEPVVTNCATEEFQFEGGSMEQLQACSKQDCVELMTAEPLLERPSSEVAGQQVDTGTAGSDQSREREMEIKPYILSAVPLLTNTGCSEPSHHGSGSGLPSRITHLGADKKKKKNTRTPAQTHVPAEGCLSELKVSLPQSDSSFPQGIEDSVRVTDFEDPVSKVMRTEHQDEDNLPISMLKEMNRVSKSCAGVRNKKSRAKTKKNSSKKCKVLKIKAKKVKVAFANAAVAPNSQSNEWDSVVAAVTDKLVADTVTAIATDVIAPAAESDADRDSERARRSVRREVRARRNVSYEEMYTSSDMASEADSQDDQESVASKRQKENQIGCGVRKTKSLRRLAVLKSQSNADKEFDGSSDEEMDRPKMAARTKSNKKRRVEEAPPQKKTTMDANRSEDVNFKCEGHLDRIDRAANNTVGETVQIYAAETEKPALCIPQIVELSETLDHVGATEEASESGVTLSATANELSAHPTENIATKGESSNLSSQLCVKDEIAAETSETISQGVACEKKSKRKINSHSRFFCVICQKHYSTAYNLSKHQLSTLHITNLNSNKLPENLDVNEEGETPTTDRATSDNKHSDLPKKISPLEETPAEVVDFVSVDHSSSNKHKLDFTNSTSIRHNEKVGANKGKLPPKSAGMRKPRSFKPKHKRKKCASLEEIGVACPPSDSVSLQSPCEPAPQEPQHPGDTSGQPSWPAETTTPSEWLASGQSTHLPQAADCSSSGWSDQVTAEVTQHSAWPEMHSEDSMAQPSDWSNSATDDTKQQPHWPKLTTTSMDHPSEWPEIVPVKQLVSSDGPNILTTEVAKPAVVHREESQPPNWQDLAEVLVSSPSDELVTDPPSEVKSSDWSDITLDQMNKPRDWLDSASESTARQADWTDVAPLLTATSSDWPNAAPQQVANLSDWPNTATEQTVRSSDWPNVSSGVSSQHSDWPNIPCDPADKPSDWHNSTSDQKSDPADWPDTASAPTAEHSGWPSTTTDTASKPTDWPNTTPDPTTEPSDWPNTASNSSAKSYDWADANQCSAATTSDWPLTDPVPTAEPSNWSAPTPDLTDKLSDWSSTAPDPEVKESAWPNASPNQEVKPSDWPNTAPGPTTKPSDWPNTDTNSGAKPSDWSERPWCDPAWLWQQPTYYDSSLGFILGSVHQVLDAEAGSDALPPPALSGGLSDLQSAMGATDEEMVMLQRLGEGCWPLDEPEIMDLDNQREAASGDNHGKEPMPTPSKPYLPKERKSMAQGLLSQYEHKEMVCPACNRHFLGLGPLQSHVAAAHGPESSPRGRRPKLPPLPSTGQGPTPRPLHVCPLCKELHRSEESLRTHIEVGHAQVAVSAPSKDDKAEGLKTHISTALGGLLNRALNNFLIKHSWQKRDLSGPLAVEQLASTPPQASSSRFHTTFALEIRQQLDARRRSIGTPGVATAVTTSTVTATTTVSTATATNTTTTTTTTSSRSTASLLASQSQLGLIYAPEKQERPYRCHVCNDRFLIASTRNRHMARAHKGAQSSATEEKPEVAETRAASDGDSSPGWRNSPVDWPVDSNVDADLEEDSFLCSDCGITFQSPVEVLKHRESEHQPTPPSDSTPSEESVSCDKAPECSPASEKMLGTWYHLAQDEDEIKAKAEAAIRELSLPRKGRSSVNWGSGAFRFTAPGRATARRFVSLAERHSKVPVEPTPQQQPELSVYEFEEEDNTAPSLRNKSGEKVPSPLDVCDSDRSCKEYVAGEKDPASVYCKQITKKKSNNKKGAEIDSKRSIKALNKLTRVNKLPAADGELANYNKKQSRRSVKKISYEEFLGTENEDELSNDFDCFEESIQNSEVQAKKAKEDNGTKRGGTKRASKWQRSESLGSEDRHASKRPRHRHQRPAPPPHLPDSDSSSDDSSQRKTKTDLLISVFAKSRRNSTTVVSGGCSSVDHRTLL